MNRHYKIVDSINRFLTIVNAGILCLATMTPLNFEKVKQKKIPVFYNFLLFVILFSLLVIMTYGSYRRQTD